MTVATFYATSHWRNGFAASGPNAHSGLDIGGHDLGAEIPLVRAGRLVARGYDAYYGFFASFDTGDYFDIYCHMLTTSPLKIGTEYVKGNTVGKVGNSGLWSNGRHLHYMIADSKSPHARPNYDPAPIVLKALPKKPVTGGAGTVTTPIPADPKPAPPIPKEPDMRLAKDPIQSTATVNVYWVVGNGAPKKFTGNQAAANEFASAAGLTFTPTAAQWPAFVDAFTPVPVAATVTDTQLAAISAGVKVDLSSVLDAIRQVPTTAANKIIAWLSRP